MGCSAFWRVRKTQEILGFRSNFMETRTRFLEVLEAWNWSEWIREGQKSLNLVFIFYIGLREKTSFLGCITHSLTHRTYLPTKTQTTFNIAFSFLNNASITRNNKFSFSNNDLKASNFNFLLPGFSSKRRFSCTSRFITAGLILCCVKSSSCWVKSRSCSANQLPCTHNPNSYRRFQSLLYIHHFFRWESFHHCHLTQSICASFNKLDYTKP